MSSLTREMPFQIGPCLIRQQKRGNYAVRARGERFSLWEMGPGRWRASYGNSNGRVRPQFQAESLEEALSTADEILFGKPEPEGPGEISDVFSAWKETLSCTTETIDTDYWPRVLQFVAWTDIQCFQYWKDLRLQHLQVYSNELVARGLAKRTIELKTRVVRMASRWAARNWPERYRDWANGFRLPTTVGPVAYQERTSLTLDEVCEFLFWLRGQINGWNILPGIALQGLCGLRVKEVLRIGWDAIDFREGTATVEGIVKNIHSVRRLPLPALVLEILAEAPQVGERLLCYTSRGAYGQAFRRQWKRYGGPRIEPKGFRRTLPTEAVRLAFSGYAMERYIGHSPRTITDRHYVATDLQALMREQVVERIDEILEPHMRAWREKSGSKMAVVQFPVKATVGSR